MVGGFDVQKEMLHTRTQGQEYPAEERKTALE